MADFVPGGDPNLPVWGGGRGAISKIVIFDEGLYHGNGIVIKWCDKITLRFALEARKHAPMRTGRLRAGIIGNSRRIGVRTVEGRIASRAPYSTYVLGGTRGPIMSNRMWEEPHDYKAPGVNQAGYLMPLPAGGGWPARRAAFVSGQRPQNFLLIAWRITGHTHTAIRGIAPLSSIANF